jgi:uncharacterized protein YbaR (Trm112 family)
MNIELLDVMRCPFCGGHLELVTSMLHRTAGDQIQEGILGCHCCVFPIVDGIPVLHLQPAAVSAREHLEGGRSALARRTMIGVDAGVQAERFEAAAASSTSTYRDLVEALGPGFESGYFLYRFSDPTFIVAQAVARSVAGSILHGTRRAADVCGGSGHLTRTLLDLSSPPPVLADLYFAKLWLARRFTAPGCEPVCCDGNAPLPFARGAFGFAMCSDALHYIWTKRLFVGELSRLVDGPEPGAVVVSHAHNALAWSPSHGQPLPPGGYRNLFESLSARLFSERSLFADVVAGGPLDLSRADAADALDGDPALTIVASADPAVFRPHRLDPPAVAGELRINPLYEIESSGTGELRLCLRFPDAAYEAEYAAARTYLPQEAVVRRADLEELEAGGSPESLADLITRRVIVDLPKRYY